MNLPESLSNAQSWTVIGPMGPKLSPQLNSLPTLAVDGGAAFCERVDVWTGDHDSLKSPLVCAYKLSLSSSKDFSDLASAFGILAQTKARNFHLWGFLGERIDHELFNLGEASTFLSARPQQQLSFYNSRGKILIKFFSAGTHYFDHEGTFSMGSLREAAVKLTGECKYKISAFTQISPLSSYGLSNMAHGLVEIAATSPVFIVFPEVK